MHYFIDTFKYIAQTNTINFLIMVGILWYIVKKFNLVSSIDDAIKTVSSNIQKSDVALKKSEQALHLAKEEIEKLPAEIKKISDETDAKAQSLKEQIETSTSKAIDNIKASVPKILSIEEKKISNEIVNETVRNSISSAENEIIKILSSNPKLHEKFIEDSLADLDEVKL